MRVRALARNPHTAGLPPSVEVVRRRARSPRDFGCMPRWHRYGVPGVDRPAGRCRSRFAADREARTAHRITDAFDLPLAFTRPA
ncbi:MAG: hypothetical protein ABSH46_14115 [Bryobacteraceae bacterium]